jgi:peptide deformylase
MADTMYNAPGVGLAANQVGRSLRIVVIDTQKPEEGGGLIELVNPEIVATSGSTTYEEGCLSVPEFYANVKRHNCVTVRGRNREGQPVEICAEGFLAVVLQHEIDHLDGKLFIDHIGFLAKDSFKRKWKKKHKDSQAD